jgi:hypothetical protein
MAMILVPLPRFVLPTARPLFCRREGPIYERFPNIDLASFLQIFGQLLGHPFENTLPYLLMEPPVACLVWWIPLRQIFPGGASAQYP